MQGQVVEGHVAKVRSGIGEPHDRRRVVGDLSDRARAVVRDDGAPPQLVAELCLQVHERLDGIDPAFRRHLTEGLAHQGLVGAADDDRLIKLAVIRTRCELVVPLLAEPGAEIRVRHQPSTSLEIADCQSLGTGAELLHHRHVEPVDEQVEHQRHRLEAHVAAQDPVERVRGGADEPVAAMCHHRIEHRQQVHPQCRAADPGRHRHEDRDVPAPLKIGDHLKDPSPFAQHLGEGPVLAESREHRRRRARVEPVAAELVPRQRVETHSEVPGVERLVEQAQHFAPFGPGGLGRSVDGAFQTHDRRANGRMPEKQRDVGAEWQRPQVREVPARVVPVLGGFQERQHHVARHAFDAAELIREVFGLAHHEGQSATADEHRGDAVSHRLSEARGDLQLGVVVRVQVDEAGGHPTPVGIDDRRCGRCDEPETDRRHHPIAHEHVSFHRRRSGPVEDAAVADENGWGGFDINHVVGHGRTLPIPVPTHRDHWPSQFREEFTNQLDNSS